MVKFSAADLASIEAPTVDMLKSDERRTSAFKLSYDGKWDVLFIREEPKQAAVSLPVGQDAWLRYNPQTLEIVGAEVEDFEKVFLVRHPNLKADWKQIKPYVTKHRPSVGDDLVEQIAALIHQVLGWLGKPLDEGTQIAPRPA